MTKQRPATSRAFSLFRSWVVPSLFLSLLFAFPAISAAQVIRVEDPARQGRVAEQRGDWIDACRFYDEAYRRDRTRTDCKEGYQRSLRRFHLQRRHRDTTYRDILARLKPSDASEIYKEVLSLLSAAYVDHSRTDLTMLFQQGVRELRFALDDENFRRDHLPEVPVELIQAFKLRLGDWMGRKIRDRNEAAEEVASVIRVAQEIGLGNRHELAPVLTLEFACGACNALDEYTLFLTPTYPVDSAAQRGKQSSAGFDVNLVEGRLEITRVYPRSPAEDLGLAAHDRILKIDGQTVQQMPLDLIGERLRGESGSILELQILSPGQLDPRIVKIERRPLVAPTVDYRILAETMDAEPIGYLRITSFQENTLQEVQEALAQLNTKGIKGLVLDLRGNPGGLFRSAVQISELFLGSGVIVISRSPIKSYKGPIKADIANPFELPMAVLIDSDTASSAEVLAGALKERPGTRLMGQTSYGKGSIQSVIPLGKSTAGIRMSAGIRLTVAHLFSPTREEPYTGRGIAPHDFLDPEGDSILTPARAALLQTIRGMMMIR